MKGLFSKIAAGEIPSHKIAESDKYFAFLDINPLANGHTLVIPRKEVDYLFDLEDDDLAGLIQFSKKVAKAIEKVVPCERIGVSVIGLEVPHAHVHLIPIYSVHDMNFAKSRVQLSDDDFKELASAIAREVV